MSPTPFPDLTIVRDDAEGSSDPCKPGTTSQGVQSK